MNDKNRHPDPSWKVPVYMNPVSLWLYSSGWMYTVFNWVQETLPVSVSDIIVYLAAASVAMELSEDTTGASAVLTSAVWCTAAWDRCSSETAVAVSASITVAIVAVISACTAGAAVVPGATASAVLHSEHDKSQHMMKNTRTMRLKSTSVLII